MSHDVRPRRAPLILALVWVALASLSVRTLNGVRVSAGPGDDGWYATDPDSFYHMRRLERALAEGEVAGRDPLLAPGLYAAEGGARIPWPPYYTQVLTLACAPFVPAPPARSAFLERFVASAPVLFGVLTSLLIALAAASLVPFSTGSYTRAAAALFAGTSHAFLFASLKYSHWGTGDHHAWITFLHTAALLVCSRALRAGPIGRPAASVLRGASTGILLGLALGSWVAAIVHVVLLDLALGWLLVRRSRGSAAGLPAFCVALHAAAALVLAPAVLASPWGAFEVVNLSWFHLAYLVSGAAVCTPFLVWPGQRRRALAGAGLVLLIVCATALLGPAAEGVREGFRWAGGANDFMGFINESQPLLGGSAGSWNVLFKYLGYGAPFGALAGCVGLVLTARGRATLTPWVVSLPFLVVLAILQRRFADAAGVPLCVLAGWGVGLVVLPVARRAPRAGLWLALASGLGAALLNPAVFGTTRARAAHDTAFVETVASRRQRALRDMLEKLRAEPAPESGDAVLTHWDLGHAIEWVARKPTVATNFGSYLGEESYRAPWLFFTEEDEARAEAILDQQHAGWVLVTSDFERNLSTMLTVTGRRHLLYTVATELVPLSTRRRACLGFLRRVHGTLIPERPAVGAELALYERVAGARLEWSAATLEGVPASVALHARIELLGPGELVTDWISRGKREPDGSLRLRVPYATDVARGDVRAAGPLTWSIGDLQGTVEVPERAVTGGETIRVR